MSMTTNFPVGQRVTLRSFRGTILAPRGTHARDNYWLLVGCRGTIVRNDDTSEVGRRPDGARVLVKFDNEVAALGLTCHNQVPNALWLFTSDLAPYGSMSSAE